MANKFYVVELTSKERQQLKELISKGRAVALKSLHNESIGTQKQN